MTKFIAGMWREGWLMRIPLIIFLPAVLLSIAASIVSLTDTPPDATASAQFLVNAIGFGLAGYFIGWTLTRIRMAYLYFKADSRE